MRSGYFVTIGGRQMVDLFRSQRIPAQQVEPAPPGAGELELRDCFICHASEDKQAALLLANAVISRGWTVWLDQLDLTLGDSLNSEIEAALARSRFGVVLLSRAFFSKQWTRRELGALAAREISGEKKVILPVWHGVDHDFIVARSPVLADRLGVSTDLGMEKVATEISRAIGKARLGGGGDGKEEPEEVLEEVENEGAELLSIPASADQRRLLASEGADWWEYRLFAGRLMEGLLALENKWQDHELRLPAESRSALGAGTITEFLSREMAWLRRQIATVNRILDASVLEEAFGHPDKAGDADRIEAAARRLITLYESLLDWAARARNTDCSSGEEEVIELMAQMVDQPLREIRDFIRNCADQIARLDILSQGGTEKKPVVITLALKLTIDDDTPDQVIAAIERIS
jgi:hypothetical protein